MSEMGKKKKVRVGGKPSRNEVNRIRGQSEFAKPRLKQKLESSRVRGALLF